MANGVTDGEWRDRTPRSNLKLHLNSHFLSWHVDWHLSVRPPPTDLEHPISTVLDALDNPKRLSRPKERRNNQRSTTTLPCLLMSFRGFVYVSHPSKTQCSPPSSYSSTEEKQGLVARRTRVDVSAAASQPRILHRLELSTEHPTQWRISR
jgi:hypothetical protein